MMTSGITSNTITDGQRKQLFRFLEDGGEKALIQAGIEKDGLQRLLENGGEFQGDLISLIKKYCVSSEFADEEGESDCGYLSGYDGAPTLAENLADLERELAVIRAVFPEFADSDLDRTYLERIKSGEIELPYGAERWTLRPDWHKLAPQYGLAVERVLEALKKAYGGYFTSYCKGELGSNRLRETSKKARAMEALQQSQDADILLVPAQFGIRHRGRSVRRARSVMNGSEFGLGAYEIGIMLLSHPNRLQNVGDLWIDAGGDEFSPIADGDFRGTPIFWFNGGKVEFYTHWFGDTDMRCGSASGFALPLGSLPRV